MALTIEHDPEEYGCDTCPLRDGDVCYAGIDATGSELPIGEDGDVPDECPILGGGVLVVARIGREPDTDRVPV